MIAYFIKSGMCLALLLAFYHLVLEREKMHLFNRFYLLGSVLFSFLAPSFIIYIEAKNTIQTAINYINKSETTSLSFFEQYFTLTNAFLFIYLMISFVFLIRFVKNLNHIIRKIRVHEIVKSEHAKFVPVADEISPHTFWNYIFINKEDYSNKKIEEEVFTHELAHVTQKHTIDVLILETLQIVFWFNPLFFLLKKAVQLNHEFLADDKVISLHENIPKYQTLLLSKASWNNTYYLASNLNYSLTKKRLLMMKTQNSKKVIFLKKIAVIPLLAGLVLLFANRVEAQTKKKKPQIVEINSADKKATTAQMKEYNNFMKGVNKNSTLKLKDVKRIRYIYSRMTGKQKKSVKNIYEFLPPPPKPVKIEVIEVDKNGKRKHRKSPPPPKPVIVEVIEVDKNGKKKHKKLPPPPPKKKKVKIIENKNEPREVIEIEEVHEEIEIEEVHEEKEEIEVVEEKHEHVKEVIIHEEEIEEVHEVKHLEELEIIHENETEHLKKTHIPNFDQLKKKGFTFYLNGKKISTKRAKKIKVKKMKKIDIVKGEKGDNGKLYIYTK